MSRVFQLALLLELLSAGGCATMQAITESYARGVAREHEVEKRMVFGGPGHQTYLGCITCPDSATDAIANTYGEHGNKYSATSLLNPYGDFGSRYSDYSMCNPYATDPPVIVDASGNFYGRLTVNRYHRQRTTDPGLVSWIEAVCR